MGGYISLAFAEKYPELLNAFGLFHSTAYADDEAKKEARRKGIEFIKNNGAAAFIKNTTPNLFSEKTKKENPELVEKLVDQSQNFSSEALIQYYEAMIQRPDRTSVLKSFQKPVLFIIGQTRYCRPLAGIPGTMSFACCFSYPHFEKLRPYGHVGRKRPGDQRFY